MLVFAKVFISKKIELKMITRLAMDLNGKQA